MEGRTGTDGRGNWGMGAAMAGCLNVFSFFLFFLPFPSLPCHHLPHTMDGDQISSSLISSHSLLSLISLSILSHPSHTHCPTTCLFYPHTHTPLPPHLPLSCMSGGFGDRTLDRGTGGMDRIQAGGRGGVGQAGAHLTSMWTMSSLSLHLILLLLPHTTPA